MSHGAGETVLAGWTPPRRPERAVIAGRYARLEPLAPDHAAALFDAFAEDASGNVWRYLSVGPFADLNAYRTWFDAARAGDDPLHFAVRMADGRLGGSLSLMRIKPRHGVIETGGLTFAPRLQRTREASEAVILLMRWAFGAGYRRFEWKCDAENLPSRRAAERFGLRYEGTFRQHMVIKGRNRDTAWFAATDADWPALDAAFVAWLEPLNFYDDGGQIARLSAMTGPLLRR